MEKEGSLEVTAHIARIIAEEAPLISYTDEETERERARYGEKKLLELKKRGFYHDDFELFFVLLRFCDRADLWKRADEGYLKKLFSEARRFDKSVFCENEYLKRVKVEEKRIGSFLLTNATYRRGEIFQYDMPSLTDEIVVPKLGFFTESTSFPAVYEGVVPWVSICPSEIFSMEKDVPAAKGRVLVLGLGLGYYPFRIASLESVKEIVVVEKSPQILRLFREQLLPQFPHKEKLRLVEADAFRFLAETKQGDFDFCYADIWEGWADGAVCYEKILPHEKRLSGCTFRYWIKDEILWYKENG